MSRPFGTALAALLLAATLGSPAWAERGERALGVGVGNLSLRSDDAGVVVKRQAPYLQGELRYAVTDFVELGGLLRVGVGLGDGRDPELVGALLAEARYAIDALTWVPWFGGGLGLLVRGQGPKGYFSGGGPSFDPTAHLGVGVDWRPSRRVALGAAFRFHLSLTELGQSLGPFDATLSCTFYAD
ncbi:MAG: hypothetical protein H6744_15745 [Deltaproteobacteria bacterium]|nr:hypothetical protein [Deltaproteobacteria bacterium]